MQRSTTLQAIQFHFSWLGSHLFHGQIDILSTQKEDRKDRDCHETVSCARKDREAHFASRSFSIHYNERRKFKTSCFCDALRLLKLVMTASASETQVWRCSKGWK